MSQSRQVPAETIFLYDTWVLLVGIRLPTTRYSYSSLYSRDHELTTDTPS